MWEEVLRNNFVGCDLEYFTRDGMHVRGPIESIALEGNVLRVVLEWAARIDTVTEAWVAYAEGKRLSFPVNLRRGLDFVGHVVHFDTEGTRVAFGMNNGQKLDASTVKGLNRYTLTVESGDLRALLALAQYHIVPQGFIARITRDDVEIEEGLVSKSD